jgi:hypothetical protein
MGTRDSLFTEKHRRLDAYNGIAPNVCIIERIASPNVEYKYLELIPHVTMQFTWSCQAFDRELGGRDKWRARTANAEWPLYGRRGPTREMVNDGGDGCA